MRRAAKKPLHLSTHPAVAAAIRALSKSALGDLVVHLLRTAHGPVDGDELAGLIAHHYEPVRLQRGDRRRSGRLVCEVDQ